MTSDVQDIPMAKVHANPNQPRKTFPLEHIERLAASIKARGLLQPITVRPVGKTGKFEIVAGECRYRAHAHAGLKTIRAIVRAMTDQEMQLLAVMENLQRRDMNPIEEANAYKTLMDGGFTVGQVVDELGLKSTAIVTQRLALLNLSPDIQQLVATGNLAVNMAWGVAQAPANLQMRMIRDIQAGRFRTAEQVKHAGIAMREAAAQGGIFGDLPEPSKQDIAALTRLEAKLEEVALIAAAGFKNGECVAAQRVSPGRVLTMADKIALIRKHLLAMEHDLRRVATQTEIRLEVAA
jgi:ParB family chromosome partitioning protein